MIAYSSSPLINASKTSQRRDAGTGATAKIPLPASGMNMNSEAEISSEGASRWMRIRIVHHLTMVLFALPLQPLSTS